MCIPKFHAHLNIHQKGQCKMETFYIILTWKTKPKTVDQNLPGVDPPFSLLGKVYLLTSR